MVAIVILLLVLSAIFSGTETAFTSVNKLKMQRSAARDWRARGVLRILENPERFLSVVLIGNNIANIFAASILTATVVEEYGDDAAWKASLLLTLVVLVFAEITPKTAATLRPEGFAQWMVPFVRAMEILLLPAVWVTTALARVIFFVLRIPKDRAIWVPSTSELRHLFDQSEAHGHLHQEIGSMLDGVLDLSRVTAGQIMVPRGKVIAVSLEEDVSAVREQFLRSGFSRLVVYEDSPEEVIGFVASRDLFRATLKPNQSITRWQSLVRPFNFHLDETPILDVLRQMRQTDAAMAGIVDEYGAFEGVVTLEDILEEMVYSEAASRKIPSVKRLDGSVEFAGDVSLRDALRLIGIETLPETTAETVGGWVLQLGGRAVGDMVMLEGLPWEVEVLAGDQAGINSVRFHPLNQPVADEDTLHEVD